MEVFGMADSQVFISYSRQQLYFAESLTLGLQNYGLSVWFDLQHLLPGSDWAVEIAAGIEASSAIVLIVSQAAIESPFVRREWETAMETGKPIYLVIYEPVELPTKLKYDAVIDMRAGFNRKLTRLADCLSGQRDSAQACQDRVPKPNFLGIQLRMPFPVLTVILTMIGAAIAVFYIAPAGLEAAQMNNPTLQVLLLMVGVWALYSAWNFLKHKTGYTAARYLTMLPFIGALPIAVLTLITLPATIGRVFDDRPRPGESDTLIFILLILALAAAAGYAYIYAMRFSPAVLRWLPGGHVPDWFRRRVNQGSLRTLGETADKPKRGNRYQLIHHPADENVATEIQNAMAAAQHKQVWADGETDLFIMVLSNFTAQADVERMIADHAGNLICIVVAQIDIPETAAALTQFQWLDYRARNPKQLAAFAQSLRGTSESAALFGLETIPGNVEEVGTPLPVLLFSVTVLRGYGAGHFAAGLLALIVTLGLIPNDTGASTLEISGIVIGLGLLWVATQVLNRTITQSRALMIAMPLLVAGVVLQIGLIERVMTFGTLALQTVIGVGVWTAFTYRAIGRWLPQTIPPKNDAATLAHDGAATRIWAMNALFIIINIALMVTTVMTIQQQFPAQ
jgi:hypothetical protein